MLTGATQVYHCPDYQKVLLSQTIVSMNGLRAKYYSDGRIEGPYYYEQNRITECPACGCIFWLDPRHQADEFYEEYDEGDPLIAAHYHSIGEWADRLDLQGWSRALSEKVFENPKAELYLRQRLLWELNKGFLDNSGWEGNQQMELWEDTIRGMLLVLQPQRAQDYLLKVELHRNLGQFEQALESLDQITNQDVLAKAYQMHQRVVAQDRWVFRFQVGTGIWFLDRE